MGPSTQFPVVSWDGISFRSGVVGRQGRIDILCEVEYSSRIGLERRRLLLDIESFVAGSALSRTG